MDKKEQVVKPLTVKIEDFRSAVSDAINRSELPPFMIELVMREVFAGVMNVAQQEYAQGRVEWGKISKVEKEGEE